MALVGFGLMVIGYSVFMESLKILWGGGWSVRHFEKASAVVFALVFVVGGWLLVAYAFGA